LFILFVYSHFLPAIGGENFVSFPGCYFLEFGIVVLGWVLATIAALGFCCYRYAFETVTARVFISAPRL